MRSRKFPPDAEAVKPLWSILQDPAQHADGMAAIPKHVL